MYPDISKNNEKIEISSKTWKIGSDRLLGIIDNEESLKQAVSLRIDNAIGENIIFSDSYGSEIHKLLGESYEMIVLKLPEIIRNAVVLDDRIEDVEDFSFEKNYDSILIKFRIITKNKKYEDMEVILDNKNI